MCLDKDSNLIYLISFYSSQRVSNNMYVVYAISIPFALIKRNK